MDAQAGMLARLFERSMGLGPEWRVEDVWFESPESGCVLSTRFEQNEHRNLSSLRTRRAQAF